MLVTVLLYSLQVNEAPKKLDFWLT